MTKLDLDTPVNAINRVGKTTAARLKRLGIETVKDLIFYYPIRWQDLSFVSKINQLQPTESATIKGKIQLVNSRRASFKKTNLTEALIADETGSIKVIWFNQPYLSKYLQPGDEIFLSGKVDFDKYNLHFVNPVYEKAGRETTHTARIVPIYSLTSNLTQKQLRFLIKTSLDSLMAVKDYLPTDIIRSNQLVDLFFALKQIHFPSSDELLHQAITRLKFDELFLLQLRSAMQRNQLLKMPANSIIFNEQKTKDFVANLPFTLTNDQRKVAWQILSDLGRNFPMSRLLEGEVGSGKTVVAALAIFNCSLAGKQSAMIAPTEILARQHYDNLLELLKPNNVSVALFSRGQLLIDDQKVKRKEMIEKIADGQITVLIGTHAIIQDKIIFNDLALAIVDEQHRFGVKQRQALAIKSGNKKITPHLLSMTATPIPRTLALAIYGDLDISLIKELPKQRKKVITKIVEQKNRPQAYEFIKQQIIAGRQAFIVCPLIDISEKVATKAVLQEFEILKKEIFSEFNLGLLHGRLKIEEKEKVMSDFLNKKIDLLVTTSVVEVGVDVPNASVMVIEGAERFGLAQLHQFRGRVGRSNHQSFCFLFTESQSQKTKERLSALISAKDGFELAEYDLKFRGPGEIYGTQQSGWPEFKIAKLTDVNLLLLAKNEAQKIVSRDTTLEKFPLLKEKLKEMLAHTHLE